MRMNEEKIWRVSDDASEYEWSSANELLSVTDAGTNEVRGSFLYDPTGKRIRTTWIDENRDTDELFRMYLGESPVMEMRGDGSHRVYVYGDGRLLATADYAGPDGEPEIHYYLMDHLGSTIAVLDEEGHTVWPSGSNPDGYQTYQPYGEFASDPGEFGSSIPSFTGKFVDPGTGNHYFNARYHTSDTGTTKGPMQFSSPDPVYGNLSDPLSWNRYAYCRNNPVNYLDPDGRRLKLNLNANSPNALGEQDLTDLISELSALTGYSEDAFSVFHPKGSYDSYNKVYSQSYLVLDSSMKFTGGSAEARKVLTDWLDMNNSYEVTLGKSLDKLGFGAGKNGGLSSGQIGLNFEDIKNLNYPEYLNPLTFGIGAIFFHEGYHAFEGLHDPKSCSEEKGTPGVDRPFFAHEATNLIRREMLTLPTRDSYFSPSGNVYKNKIYFTLVEPVKSWFFDRTQVYLEATHE